MPTYDMKTGKQIDIPSGSLLVMTYNEKTGETDCVAVKFGESGMEEVKITPKWTPKNKKKKKANKWL
ncbi:hypothetical protein GCK72_021333 [Caenorhabditis remanei]|uniref:Uncharacterized protein n=1 Tax=Caenorhabditis remanei TaxID=31234 RepID=A0A6A5GKB1_CAERE|nr:hypothetical protein GCK72_021333 [Caenorhabditis remanei]KAF1754769.1 hypothetical protein GCK72_021333 [Caenorhabditis remanei]